jgi:hypothetical protein
MRQRCIILFLLVLLFGFASAYDWPTLQFLNFWPSARVAGLAGCFTSIADDAYTVYYNPAGLPFLRKQMVASTYNPTLVGLWSDDMYYANLSFSSPIKKNQGLGVFINYFTNGFGDAYDSSGPSLYYLCPWSRNYTFVITGAYGRQIGKSLSVGGAVKLIYYLGYYTGYGVLPTYISLGSGTCFAVDFAFLYMPISKLNVGFTIQNLGTKTHSPRYFWIENAQASLPRLSRLGIKYGPITKSKTKTLITAELTKNLVGMFYDPYNTQTFFQELKYELKDIYRGIGLEFAAYDLVHLRLGYYEDNSFWNGGGLEILACACGDTKRVSVLDYLFNSNYRGKKILSIGWTYGIGITYKNASIDIGTDQYIYDFPTSNWKFTLSYQF